jgi:N-acyl-D-amino-acid deacylase
MAWSLLIKNGTVIDGTGAARSNRDVALAGDRIVGVAPTLAGDAERVIDATDLIVAPGFIDIHSHSDFFYEQCPSAESKLRQGVTTEVVGMCSFSPAPVSAESRPQVEAAVAFLGGNLRISWNSFYEYLYALEGLRVAVNIVHFVGHGPVRYAAMGGENRSPDARELDRMKGLLEEAIGAGAFGLSSGLVYAPSAFARTEELVALCRSMQARGGHYFTHIRGEADTLLESVSEAIRISEESGAPVQVAHIKAFGRENWGLFDRALEIIGGARGRGCNVTADVYPYTASSTYLSALLPEWMHEGGSAKLLDRLRDPDVRARIVRENLTVDGRWHTAQGTIGWDEVTVATCPDPAEEGLTLAKLALRRRKPPAEAMMDFLVDHENAASAVMFSQAEANVRKALSQPYVMIGSDSLGLTCGHGPHPGRPHPRMYGTFPRVLGTYVREAKLFSLETAVAKMTGQPAEKLKLDRRGLLREGHFADLVVFDPETVRDEATFENPHVYPTGIHYVVVNGQIMLDNGRFNSRSAGRVLRQNSTRH